MLRKIVPFNASQLAHFRPQQFLSWKVSENPQNRNIQGLVRERAFLPSLQHNQFLGGIHKGRNADMFYILAL